MVISCGWTPLCIRHYSKRYPSARKRCVNAIVELHVIASGDVYNNVFISLLNMYVALEAMQCCPCKSIDFIAHFTTSMLII